MSARLHAYLLLERVAMDADDEDEDAAADVRDLLDALWPRLSDAERLVLRTRSTAADMASTMVTVKGSGTLPHIHATVTMMSFHDRSTEGLRLLQTSAGPWTSLGTNMPALANYAPQMGSLPVSAGTTGHVPRVTH